MGKKSKPPAAPDLTGITAAQTQIAKESNDIAREFMGMSRDQFEVMQKAAGEELALAKQQADRLFEYQNKAFASDEEAKAFARQVGQTQIDSMNLQMEYAKKDRERYDSVTIPMQDRYINEANTYDTQERRESEAAKSSVDIQRQIEAQRNSSDARLRSMGLDPSQMRSATLLDTQNVAMAAQQAGAANAARTGVEDRGRAMRADAINMVNGLPAQSLAGFAGAGAAGQGALGAGQAGQNAQLGAISGGAGVGSTAMGFRSGALNNLANLTGSPMQWAGMGGNMYGQASSSYGNAANTMSQDYQNKMSSWQAGQQQAQQGFQNIMSVASLAGGMMMAEGGSVRGAIRRYYAEGGNVGPVQREQFPLARAVLEGDFTKMDKPKAMGRAQDLPGPSWTERLDSGAAMQGQTDPGNVWDQQAAPQQLMTRQTQMGGDNLRYLAEGGSARGAIPVRQARDKVHAMLDEGEYIIPSDVVRSVGLEKLDKMVAKYHRSNA